MPETARYTALVEGDPKKAAWDMAQVLQKDIHVEGPHIRPVVNPTPSYGFLSSKFLERHGHHLLGTTSTWFLLDIAFYSLQLAQKDLLSTSGLVHKASTMNAIEEVFQISKAMFVVALFATVPGYWFTVFFIDKIGRSIIQLGGFLLMSIFMLILGYNYEKIRGGDTGCQQGDNKLEYCNGNPKMFALLFGLTLFFANFGPNSTTFIVPAELFPARFRSTCHGISAAAGKAGAIIGAFVVQSYTSDAGKTRRAIMALSVVNMAGFFCTFLVPETKGRSLEDISEDKELEENQPVDDAHEKVAHEKDANEKVDVEGGTISKGIDKSPLETTSV